MHVYDTGTYRSNLYKLKIYQCCLVYLVPASAPDMNATLNVSCSLCVSLPKDLMRRQEELRRLEELRNQELQKRKQIEMRYSSIRAHTHTYI